MLKFLTTIASASFKGQEISSISVSRRKRIKRFYSHCTIFFIITDISNNVTVIEGNKNAVVKVNFF